MSATAFYVAKMKNLPARYGISRNMQSLLRSLDDHHTGAIDDQQLGRVVRMSPNMRKAVTETIAKLASIMEKEPAEIKDCLALIKNCTEILAAADKDVDVKGFDFMKLPTLIRHDIYCWYLNVFRWHNSGTLIHLNKVQDCACNSHNPSWHTEHRSRVNVNLALACKNVKDEMLPIVYSRYTFYFSCSCEMNRRLAENAMLAEQVRSIKVHWCGPISHEAFKKLGNCPSLKDLHIVISRVTTNWVNKRETVMRLHFQGMRQVRLYDALGLDELCDLGKVLDTVDVLHIQTKQAHRRTDEDKRSLQSLLSHKLLK